MTSLTKKVSSGLTARNIQRRRPLSTARYSGLFTCTSFFGSSGGRLAIAYRFPLDVRSVNPLGLPAYAVHAAFFCTNQTENPMSCTSTQSGHMLCACNLPQNLLHELDDSLRGISDVLQALTMFESLIDPLTTGGRQVIEVDRDQLSSWLRTLNGGFQLRLTAAQTAIKDVIQ